VFKLNDWKARKKPLS